MSSPEEIVPRNPQQSTIYMGQPLISSETTGDTAFRKSTIIFVFDAFSLRLLFRTRTPNSQLPDGTRTLHGGVVIQFDELNRGLV